MHDCTSSFLSLEEMFLFGVFQDSACQSSLTRHPPQEAAVRLGLFVNTEFLFFYEENGMHYFCLRYT